MQGLWFFRRKMTRRALALAAVLFALPYGAALAAPAGAIDELDLHYHHGYYPGFRPRFYFRWGWPYWEFPPRYLGTLEVLDIGSDSVVIVDGAVVSGPDQYLSPGLHQVTVRRFGYEDFSTQAEIRADRVTTIEPTWVAAAFGITNIVVSPTYFDPSDPGYLGGCSITLTASAPGSGSIAVVDGQGRTVRTFADIAFDSPRVELRWDGRDQNGQAVEPGYYRIQDLGSGAPGAAPVQARVRVAAGLFNRSSSIFTGVSGALFAPDARVLPAGRTESNFGGLGHFDGSSASLSGELTLETGFRTGVGAAIGPPGAGWEFAATALTDLHPGEGADPSTDTFSGTLSLKRAFNGGTPSAALYLKGSFASFFDENAGQGAPYVYDWTRFPGLSVGLPLEIDVDSLRLFVAPEIEASSYYPAWDQGPWSVPGLFVWGYLRAGIESSSDNVSVDLSAAVPTDPFSSAPVAVRLPVSVGGELRWYAPNSPFVFSLLGTGTFSEPAAPYLSAGFTATFRFD